MRRALLCLLLLTGCAGIPDDGKVQVVVGAYPFQWVAEQVGGDDVTVTNLVPPGAEPHELELTPKQVARVESADLVVRLADFQPALDDATGDRANGLEVSRAAQRRGDDPHVWLDPVRLAAVAEAVADRLSEVDSAHQSSYRSRAAALVGELTALDRTFREELTDCARTEVVTAHSAFGYLAARYGLVQHGITGISPDEEPTPKAVAAAADYAREHGVTTVFFETLVDPKVARTVAREIGATARVLDPVESVSDGHDYLTVQRANAAALHEALGCR